jgi:hypothetical protein
MKLDIEKKIDTRVAAAFEDLVPGPDTPSGQEILKSVPALVRAVWMNKIYAALPQDKTKIPEYFLEAELDQMLNEAVDECYKMVSLIADRIKEEFHAGRATPKTSPEPASALDEPRRSQNRFWQRLTPEQRKMIEEEISEAIARFRRSQFSSSVAGDAKINGIFADTLLRVNNWT